MEKIQEMKRKICELNRYRRAYYNQNRSLVSDAEYDRLFDELERMEKETGVVYADSPTQNVGYYPEENLEKIRHSIPLLSLDKTKQVSELTAFAKKNTILLMLKLDGLTVKLTYENGLLTEASTRGDGEVGENILHNIPFIQDIPAVIPYKRRLVLSGEAFIRKDDFEYLRAVLKNENGEPPKNGRNLASVAVFDPLEIDGCDVSRATLHNLTFIKELELVPGCRIMVSKRNMIIPHIEGNLSRGRYKDTYPTECPCCGHPTRVYARNADKGRMVETIHCDNPDCDSQVLRKFVHFAAKKAMNIEGLSESYLKRFQEKGWLSSFQDIYYLYHHRQEIVSMEGFGEKSYERLIDAIDKSRDTDFAHYLTAMDIPMIGRTKSRVLSRVFDGDLDAFEAAALGNYDFSKLEDFGETLNNNIHTWFADEDNRNLWRNLQDEMIFHKEEMHMTERKDNPFAGCVVVATGKLVNFTRDGINSKISELGGIPGSSVTRKTNYLICGEKAGSKLKKAQELGIRISFENVEVNEAMQRSLLIWNAWPNWMRKGWNVTKRFTELRE